MIRVIDLSVRFDSGYAVRDVSFEIKKGEYLCVVGENGSGKSTLMKAMLGLQKPTEGRVVYEGVTQREIGFVPQQTAVQRDFPTDVSEVVLSGLQGKKGLLPFYTRADRAKAAENLARLGAEAFLHKPYADLSGGQRQRVLLARALCATESVLMLDEPATGLDPVVAAEFYALLADLNKQGITLVMISHDIGSAVKYGGKILHMKTGVLYFGDSAAYMQSEPGRRMLGGALQ